MFFPKNFCANIEFPDVHTIFSGFLDILNVFSNSGFIFTREQNWISREIRKYPSLIYNDHLKIQNGLLANTPPIKAKRYL
jgi:hypothetical protein